MALLALVGPGYAAVHLQHVRTVSGEYRWTAAATAPLLLFEGRRYDKRSVTTLPLGEVLLGRTAGGGLIYGPPEPHRYAVTVLTVVAGGQATGYALSGGP